MSGGVPWRHEKTVPFGSVIGWFNSGAKNGARVRIESNWTTGLKNNKFIRSFVKEKINILLWKAVGNLGTSKEIYLSYLWATLFVLERKNRKYECFFLV